MNSHGMMLKAVGVCRSALKTELVCVLFVLIVFGFSFRFLNAGELEKPEELLDLVTRGIAHNNEQLKTADARIQIMSHTLPNEPVQWQQHIIFSDNDLRLDVTRGTRTTETLTFYKGAWWRYIPTSSRFEMAPTKDLASRFPIDPRQYGALDMRTDLIELLRTMRLKEAKVIDRNDGKSLVKLVFHQFEGKEGVFKTEFEFDSSRSFLPTLMTQTWQNNLTMSLQLTYQEVLESHAWFLKEATYRWFEMEGITSPIDDRWHQLVTHTVSQVAVNAPVDKAVFKPIETPDGTFIEDRINKHLYTKNPSLPSNSWASPLLIGINLLFLLIVVVLIVRHRRKHRHAF